jgi:hypothetical protein
MAKGPSNLAGALRMDTGATFVSIGAMANASLQVVNCDLSHVRRIILLN